MIKKAIILLMACTIISCKKDQNELIDNTPLDIKGSIESGRLIEDFTCGSTSYIFQIPYYKGDSNVEKRLNHDIKTLITQELADVNYDKNDNLKEIWKLFINECKRKICSGDISGINGIQIEHLSQNDAILSYELTYLKNEKPKRITRTFKKPELTELKIKALVKEARAEDVRRIFDINLQQSIANLSLETKTEDYKDFRAFVESNAYNFSKEEFEKTTLGVKILGKDSLLLQVSKKIDIPSKYSYINEDVKIEIQAKNMEYYLDLSPLKI